MLLLFVLGGVVFLVMQTVVASSRVSKRRSLRIAVMVMLAYGIAAVLLGGNWWPHYLLQLVPALALGTALATKRSARRLWTHYAATYAVAASVVTAVVGAGLVGTDSVVAGTSDDAVADYLKAASRDTDSVVVAYGNPNIIERSGLTTPYRYSWSLPLRGRDPHLTLLVSTLEGTAAPTWMVEVGSFDWWDIDTPAFQEVRADRYHWVADVCGHNVYLRDDAIRAAPHDWPCSPS